MSAPPQSFLCPITGEIMADPVSTSDGFSYEREAISEWFSGGHQTSPLTGAPLDRAELVPNHTLRAAIQEYVNTHPEIGDDIYRPRDVSSIRQAIGSRQWAEPQAAPLEMQGLPVYSPTEGEVPMGQAGPEFTMGGTPMGQAVSSSAGAGPVAMAQPVGIVRAPPPPPLNGLSAEDRAAAAAFAVPNWAAFLAPPKRVAAGWFGFGGGGGGAPPPPATDPNEPKVRVLSAAQGGVAAPGGGLTLEATIKSEAALLRLAQRLAAPGTAPLAALRIKAEDGDGFGTLAESFSADGAGFALLTRALHAASGHGAEALVGLLELSITKLPIKPAPAAALTAALVHHPSLSTLELWNCAIEDEAALYLARLAAADGNAALRELDLGRNLVSGACREQLEALIDRQRVHAKAY